MGCHPSAIHRGSSESGVWAGHATSPRMDQYNPVGESGTIINRLYSNVATGPVSEQADSLVSQCQVMAELWGRKYVVRLHPVSPARSEATVLLVEDDPALRKQYRDVLRAARYAVVAVADGLDALHYVERERPDVMVLDLGLPRVSGWDVYRELRARPDTQNLPIIIVTG